MRWTFEQEEILRIHGHRGAEFCRDLIARKFGVWRTVEATQRHASRIKAPLVVYQICPVCGRAERKLHRKTGVCEACNYDLLWKQQAEEAQRIISDFRKGGESNVVQASRRRYDAQRQKTTRTRQRFCGDSKNLSNGMSTPRSGRRKSSPNTIGDIEKEMCAPAR